MFSNIGWGEILFLLVLGLIIVGPERLPGLIEDVKAAIYAARKAINNAKAELNGEFGQEFQELQKPIGQITKLRSMGPKGAIARVLFDEDESFMDSFDPKKIMSEPTVGQAYRQQQHNNQAANEQAAPAPQQQQQQQSQPQEQSPQPPVQKPTFSWDDIT
ncbi:Sec-independent protein translocase subunit TatB [Corynebacterium pseudopelargi]|uniref:Sec-independent protein translocase protein TatB n=1 Tax=Corynebacterium pseudopelargi TaxID=2080757 RepID=A0A3G6IUW1_9CORY|nr:Sec-independent protein translocase subunit TatB [Corynebacterium pseudopelargi]AZA09539.1 Sec-independent protein translocase protein TatB [Corynebacterium pseudopelargi]